MGRGDKKLYVTNAKVNKNDCMKGEWGGLVKTRFEGCVSACDHANGLPTFLKPGFTPRPVGVGVKLWHSQANMDENSAGGNPNNQAIATATPTSNMDKVATMDVPCIGLHHDMSASHSRVSEQPSMA